MRLLLVVDCYLPSTKSSAKLIDDLAREFLRLGHDVTVLAPDPAIATPLVVSHDDGLQVVRVRSGQIKGASRIARALREATLSALLWRRARRVFAAQRHDAIVCYSPSIFFAPLVWRLKRLWRCPAYLVVRDLFPQWALDAGLLRRGPTYAFFKAMELAQYAVADVVGVQSPANLAYFAGVALPPRRLEVLYNWTRTEPVVAKGRRDGRVRFVFGGNLGVAQDLDLIVRVADALRARGDLAFLLVGDGSEAARIAGEVRRRRLENVAMHPAVNQADYLAMIAGADVGLIALDARLTTQNFPGKLLGYLQAGLPVVASLNAGNDLAPLLHEAKAGLCATAGDDATFRAHILALAGDAERRRQMGDNGRALLERTFSVAAAARQILAGVA